MYEKFFQCFEFTGERDGYRSHEKYISATIKNTFLSRSTIGGVGDVANLSPF